MEADFRLGMRCAFFQGAGAHVTYFHVFNKPYFLWLLHFYCHTSVHIDTLLDKYVYLLLLLAEGAALKSCSALTQPPAGMSPSACGT